MVAAAIWPGCGCQPKRVAPYPTADTAIATLAIIRETEYAKFVMK
ncbi:MAG: hypothetical protein E6Y56_01730 [Negativicoccus succinicivorans]|nr:hypothetical protein [Negativicoccus succinicivorans]